VPIEQIRVSINVFALAEVDTMKETVTLDYTTRLRWHDWRLQYNSSQTRPHRGCIRSPAAIPAGHGTRRLQLDVWAPDVWISNMVEADNIVRSQFRVHDSGSAYLSWKQRMTFACPMDFRRMPIDVQTCHLTMGTYVGDARDLNLSFHDPPVKFVHGQGGTTEWSMRDVRAVPAGAFTTVRPWLSIPPPLVALSLPVPVPVPVPVVAGAVAR
jgi:hypothetical protein